MALLSFWKKDPVSVLSFTIEQVVASAGDGKLRDNSECSKELRAFLSEVSSDVLTKYADNCLTTSFSKSGQVLQDIVNELGRRLDYQVSNGRYQGLSNVVGYDGLWKSPEGHDLLVEVKTTDGFRISLDTIAGYRNKLKAAGELADSHSMLIVVGRNDTGELEAQVRGSRHAWDMRLISVDALVRLVALKENTEETETAAKIRSVLRPWEYTRLDALIDVMFTTAKDVEEKEQAGADTGEASEDESGGWVFTDPVLIQSKRNAIIASIGEYIGHNLIKKSRATYWDSNQQRRVVCTVSKRYNKGGDVAYWYAYHPSWDAFLGAGQMGYFVLGAMDQGCAFAIPVELMRKHLDELNVTKKADGTHYWHVKILEPTPGTFLLQMAKSGNHIPLAPYMVKMVV